MKLHKCTIVSLTLLLLSWVAAGYFYINFPDQVITHWGWSGKPDGYSSRLLGAFLFPIISTLIYGLFVFLPKIDPKKENYLKFDKTYKFIINIFLMFFLAISVLAGLVNLGYPIPINIAMPALAGTLLILIGSQTGKLEQNWFIGFRFPWTLSSESVWKKTNRFGGWSLIFLGGIIFISSILPQIAGMTLFFFAILLTVFGTMSYSYVVFKKEQKQKSSQG